MKKLVAKQSIRSNAESLLLADLRAAAIPPVVGHKFFAGRGWALDFAYPQQRLGIEVDGSGFHTSDKGKRLDQQKRNAALELGWRVLAYPARETTTAKRRARIVEQIKRILCGVVSPEDAECVLVGE